MNAYGARRVTKSPRCQWHVSELLSPVHLELVGLMMHGDVHGALRINLCLVFEVMRHDTLFLKWSKFTFGVASMAYLSHVISADGLPTDRQGPSVADEPTPLLVLTHVLRGFGLCHTCA
jgi:hypothetical protein